MTRKITIVLILFVIVVLVGWDIYAAIEPTQGDTISEVISQWAGKFLIVPFSLGVFCGHWFWLIKEKISRWLTIPVLCLVAVLIITWDCYAVLISKDALRIWLENHPVMFLVLGILSGHFYWGQIKENL